MKSGSGLRSVSMENLETRKLLAAVNIMPLGDSITEALPGHASYRFFLYNQLAQAGYDVDFVGSQTGVNGAAPLYTNFDQNHEGHSGWRADEIAANAVSFATANRPDIVLLHIGTNDINQGQSNSSTITDIGRIIDNLRSVVPNVKILLAKITPESINASQVSGLNSMIATLASQKNTSTSPIKLVDQYTGFSAATDTYDGIHGNDSGERKIAAKWLSALTPILPAPTPPQVAYLSDLNPTSATNGWGAIEKDRSNGEAGSSDGQTLSIGTNGYLKGLGVHAGSDVTYNLSGANYTSFQADLGVDAEVGGAGSVVFQVYVNDVLKYTSATLTGSSAPVSMPAISLAGASTLRLVVTDAGDGADYDHADWANARFTLGPKIVPPLAPSRLAAAYNTNTAKIDLTWLDNASDEIGYRIERRTGSSGAFTVIADLGANVKSYSDGSNLVAGTTYTYRIYAYKIGANSAYSSQVSVTVPKRRLHK